MQFRRYAIYHLPTGPLGDFGAGWLGWDARTGLPAPRPAGLPDEAEALTEVPRRYGFHATLKAPFRLAEGRGPDDLALGLQLLCDHLAPFSLALEPRSDWGFVSLRPRHQPPELLALESSLVTRLDEFRAPLTAQEYDRRRPDALPAQARKHLDHWGYPFVLELFHYHLTLSGPLPPAGAEALCEALRPALAPLIAVPQPVTSVALMGEDAAGFFHLIEDVPLRG
jgi:hypothetical protein